MLGCKGDVEDRWARHNVMVFDAEDVDQVALSWNDVGQGINEAIDLGRKKFFCIHVLQLNSDATEE